LNRAEVSVSVIKAPRWLKNVSPFCLKVMELLNLSNYEISVMLCDDKTITDLNNGYRGINKPTDVLSFSQNERSKDGDNFNGKNNGTPVLLGDIVISIDTVRRNSEEYNVDYEEEIRRLIIHGLLHLTGMEHSDNEDYNEMMKLQERLLKNTSEVKLF